MTRKGPARFCPVWGSPLFFSPCRSAVADAREKRRDLGCGAIGVLAVREVSHAWEAREIEIGEGLIDPVDPGVGKQRVMLGPADAGRHIDRGELRRLTLHHPDPTLMAGAVMCKTAGEVAGLQKIIREGFEHVVERILA